MPTPKQGYFGPDGERYPGTTTIIGRFKDSGALMHWAFQQGKSGAASLYEKAEAAADIGTMAHYMIENWCNEVDPELAIAGATDEQKGQARNAFDQFLEWASETRLELLSHYQEIQLVCPVYKFGGTPDAIGKIDGKIVLLDWKTSNAIYSDYLIQLAAYRHLIENGIRMDTGKPMGIKLSGTRLLRFSKDYPDFDNKKFGGELELAFRQFVLYREAYDIDKELKKRVK